MKHRNILLVDDDVDIQELVTFFLEQSGFVVRSVADGFSALQQLQLNHYDLVLMDISMPHMNGFSLLRSIRASKKLKVLPVVMLTGSGDKSDFLKTQQYEVSDYIIKPPSRDDLLVRIERILGGRPQFEEIMLADDDQLAKASLEVDVRLVSLSRIGLILMSRVPIEKNFLIESIGIGLFRQLGIVQSKFMVTDCKPSLRGGYELFLSFLDMGASDQEKIHDWIMTKAFEKKKHA